MFPSVGYFKTIDCPQNDKESCQRPYCHFHHSSNKNRVTKNDSKPTPIVHLRENIVKSRVTQPLTDLIHNKKEDTLESEPDKDMDSTAFLSEVISAAVKKAITDNPILSQSLSRGDIISHLNTMPLFKNSSNCTSKPQIEISTKQHRLYLPPAGIPSYNPTPISELKQKNVASTSAQDSEYKPRSFNKISYGDKITDIPEAEFSPVEDDEQSKADFDILEQVLAERSSNPLQLKVNNNKQKLKRLSIPKKASSKSRTCRKEDSVLNMVSNQIEDKLYEETFLPPSPVFKSAADIPSYSHVPSVYLPEMSQHSDEDLSNGNNIAITKPTYSDNVPLKKVNTHSSHSMLPQIAHLSCPLAKDCIPIVKVAPTVPIEFSAVEELLQKLDGRNEIEFAESNSEQKINLSTENLNNETSIQIEGKDKTEGSKNVFIKEEKSSSNNKRKFDFISKESNNIKKKKKIRDKSHSKKRKKSDMTSDCSDSSNESDSSLEYYKRKKHKKHSKHKRSSRKSKKHKRRKKHKRCKYRETSSRSDTGSNSNEVSEASTLPVALCDIKIEKNITKNTDILPVLIRSIKKESESKSLVKDSNLENTTPLLKSPLPILAPHIHSNSPQSNLADSSICNESSNINSNLSLFDIVALSLKQEKTEIPTALLNSKVSLEEKADTRNENVRNQDKISVQKLPQQIIPIQFPSSDDNFHNTHIRNNKKNMIERNEQKIASTKNISSQSKASTSHFSSKDSYSATGHHLKSPSSRHRYSSGSKETYSSTHPLRNPSHSFCSKLSQSTKTSHNKLSKSTHSSSGIANQGPSNKNLINKSVKSESLSNMNHHMLTNKHNVSIKNPVDISPKTTSKDILRSNRSGSTHKGIGDKPISKLVPSQNFAELLSAGDVFSMDQIVKRKPNNVENKKDSKKIRSRRHSVHKLSGHNTSDESQSSPEIGSPLPDLSALDEINKEDWDELLSENNAKSSENNAKSSENYENSSDDNFQPSTPLHIHPDSTLDSDDANDPAVMQECFQLFSNYNPRNKSRQSLKQELPAKKPEESKESIELPVRHQRNARTGATGNLLAPRQPLRNQMRTTPSQTLLERYQKIKDDNKVLQNKLDQHRSNIEPKICKDSPRLVSSSLVSSSCNKSASKSSKSAVTSSADQYGVSSTADYSRKKRIARAPSNVVALMNSKNKLLEFRKPFIEEAGSTSIIKETIAITNVKGTKRIAHIPTHTESIERPLIVSDGRSKLPQNIRQRYLNIFIEETLKFCQPIKLAYDIAIAEERVCHDKAVNRVIYLNLVVNTVKRLRNQNLSEVAQEIKDRDDSNMCDLSSPEEIKDHSLTSKKKISHPVNHKTMTHFSVLASGGQKGSWSIEINTKNKNINLDDITKGRSFYKHLKKYIVTDVDLEKNGFPLQDSNEKGKAIIKKVNFRKKINPSAYERICARCSVVYKVDKYGVPLLHQNCVYHWGRPHKTRGRSGFETKYSCCQNDNSAEGCSLGDVHVSDNYNPDSLKGFVHTFSKEKSQAEVFALDCEMCYTTEGNELTRVTVINCNRETVYETLVLPDNPIIDYNTRFSGITAEDMKDVTVSLRDVQAALLTKFSTRTILMGHSLESDFMALKLIHRRVVDTSIVFPHKLGAPYKRALRNLASELITKIIQNDISGHDSAEDAITCIELMQWKVKEDFKLAGLR